MIKKYLLQDVVEDFVESLSCEDKLAIQKLILNHQIKENLVWYKEVISRYLRGEGAKELVEDIDNKYPDESVLKMLDSTDDWPIFEAEIILRETKKALDVVN